jgi:hypothetical protein
MGSHSSRSLQGVDTARFIYKLVDEAATVSGVAMGCIELFQPKLERSNTILNIVSKAPEAHVEGYII